MSAVRQVRPPAPIGVHTFFNFTLELARVGVPVGLAAAAEDRPGSGVSLRSLHEACGSPVEQRSWCPVDERIVEEDEIVDGYELSPGQFVLLGEEGEESAVGGAPLVPTKVVPVKCVVALDEIDPLLMNRSYFLVPKPDTLTLRAYALVAAALERNEAGGLARLVMRGREHAVVIHARAGVLHLTTLRPAIEQRSSAPIAKALRGAGPDEEELGLAGDLLELLRQPFAAGQRLTAAKVWKLIGRKVAAGQIVRSPQAKAVAPADLAAALRQSVPKGRGKA